MTRDEAKIIAVRHIKKCAKELRAVLPGFEETSQEYISLNEAITKLESIANTNQ